MFSLDNDETVRSIRQTNDRLRAWLDGLVMAAMQSTVATPQQISGLLSELMRAGEKLRALPRVKSPELQQELDQYRKNVQQLRDLLPSVQRALLERRAYLEAERARLRSAAEWARGSRQTL
jgi:ABC-type transporter Mla subunit MlaD